MQQHEAGFGEFGEFVWHGYVWSRCAAAKTEGESSELPATTPKHPQLQQSELPTSQPTITSSFIAGSLNDSPPVPHRSPCLSAASSSLAGDMLGDEHSKTNDAQEIACDALIHLHSMFALAVN